MESWVRRLKYYGVGFGIGLIFVIFFFQNRGCSWLPSNRVKNALLDRVLVISDSTIKILDSKGLDTDDIIQVLNDGSVNFSDSDKERNSKVYVIEKNEMAFAFTLPHESFISEVFVDVKNSKVVPTTAGYGSPIYFPADDNLIYPDSTQIVTCQQEELSLIEPKKILKKIKTSGKIDFSRTNLKRRPKPEHFIIFTHDNAEVGAKVIWYKNKLNITSFESSKITGCN